MVEMTIIIAQTILGVYMRVYVFVEDSNDEQATTLLDTSTGELCDLSF